MQRVSFLPCGHGRPDMSYLLLFVFQRLNVCLVPGHTLVQHSTKQYRQQVPRILNNYIHATSKSERRQPFVVRNGQRCYLIRNERNAHPSIMTSSQHLHSTDIPHLGPRISERRTSSVFQSYCGILSLVDITSLSQRAVRNENCNQSRS